MRRILLSLLVLSTCWLSVAEGAKSNWVDKPQQALSRLKRAVARKDRAGEWAALSPTFKARMSKRAGRTLDFGDYTVFRDLQSKDKEVRQVEHFLRTARMSGVRRSGKGYVSANIRFGGPLFFGKTMRVRLIYLDLWRLEVKGESQPYWGFTKDRSIIFEEDAATRAITLKTFDNHGKVSWQQTFAKDEITRFVEFKKWFFDGFGNAEQRFFGV